MTTALNVALNCTLIELNLSAIDPYVLRFKLDGLPAVATVSGYAELAVPSFAESGFQAMVSRHSRASSGCGSLEVCHFSSNLQRTIKVRFSRSAEDDFVRGREVCRHRGATCLAG